MRKLFLAIFLFVIANFLFVLLHFWIFRTDVPYLAFATGAVHVVALILFPYRKIFQIQHDPNDKTMAGLVVLFVLSMISCNRPEPQNEGVLMSDYGRSGLESFKTVTGAQGMLGPGSELYQVPMWEQQGDPEKVTINTKDASEFTVDPAYTYAPIRGKGPEIVYTYKNYDIGKQEEFFEAIETKILNKRVTDAYREEARSYTTDSLMNNLANYESNVSARLEKEFANKYFNLTTLTSGLKPPKEMTDAINLRNVAVQRANEVRNQLETSRMLLEKARIDAQTNQVQSSGLTHEVLTQQWIEAIRTTQNKVIITDGKTPVILGH